MAIKPPTLGEVVGQVQDLLGDNALRSEVDKGMKSLAQSALGRLDVVTREEFDAQVELLARAQARVDELERELASLQASLEEKDTGSGE
jgi:BMFP domain-containing protein YqiC